MATFVLVHGAWHGAWCWKKPAAILRDHAETVYAIDLPGHGEHPADLSQVTMDDYVDAVVEALDGTDGNAILVGHSMGGLPITAAAERRPEKLALLVYLTAFLPESGQSLFDLEAKNPNPTVPPSIVPSDDGKTATVAGDKLVELFYHDCSTEDVEFAKANICPQPLQPLAAPIETTPERFGSVRRAYIECSEDRAISLALQRIMQDATPCALKASLPTSHSPFFSAPEQLADELLRLSRSA